MERRDFGQRRLSENARNKSLLQGETFCLSSRTALALKQSNLSKTGGTGSLTPEIVKVVRRQTAIA
jgi:hypothetical protein